MRVLVIGASGFVGRTVWRALLARGHEVSGTSTRPGKFIRCDIADERSCHRLLHHRGFDAVINLAGAGVTHGLATTEDMLRVNCDGARVLAEAVLAAAPVPWLVHASSSTEPLPDREAESPYSQSKALGTRAIEHTFRKAGAPMALARIHNTYGLQQPDGRFVMSVFKHMLAGEPFSIQHPQRTRDFCLVDEVACHLVRVAEHPQSTPINCEIGTGRGTALWDVAHMIRRRIGAPDHLIRRETVTPADPHLEVVADRLDSGFCECRTPLETGIDQIAGSIT